MREVERRAQAYGLPPIRWPDPFPGNTLFAMRVATFATEIGRGVSLPLAAFRQAFAAGRDLSDPDNVFIAAASAELHPRALRAAAERDSIKAALKAAPRPPATPASSACPPCVVGDEVFWGDDRLDEAAAAAG